MLNIRLEPKQETYLNNFVDNKSEYVRSLINEDIENELYIDAFLNCKDNFLEFHSRHAPDIGINSARRYDEEIGYYFGEGRNVFVNKGRQLGISKIFARCALWKAAFEKDSEVVVSGNKDLLSLALDQHRGTAPGGMLPDIKTSNRLRLELKNGSTIRGVESDPLHGSDPDLLIFDEYGYSNVVNDLRDGASRGVQVLVSTTGIHEDMVHQTAMLEMSMPESDFEYLEIPSTVSEERGQDWIKETKEMIGDEKFLKEHTAPRMT